MCLIPKSRKMESVLDLTLFRKIFLHAQMLCNNSCSLYVFATERRVKLSVLSWQKNKTKQHGILTTEIVTHKFTLKRISSLVDIEKIFKKLCGASLVMQWLRIRLPMQGTWVRSLVREDPTCLRATKAMRHNY